MKLLELISEQKIIIREQQLPFEIPKLTTLSSDGKEYKWNGSTWIEDKTKKPAKAGVVSKLTNTWKTMNTPAMFDAGNTRPVQVGKGYLVNLKDQTFKFKDQKTANRFIAQLKNGKSIDTAVKSLKPGAVKEISRGALSSFKVGVTMSKEQIETAAKKNPAIQKVFSGPKYAGMLKLFTALGINVLLYQSFIVNANEVYNTPADKFEGGEAEKEELLDVITGLFVSQVILVLSMAFRVLKVQRLITLIRAPIRAMQLGAAATGVGAVPSLITMIVTEAAFWGAAYLLTRPAVQMKLAEYIAHSIADGVFETIGNAADIIMQSLDAITNGAIGGATLRDALTFKKGVKKMPSGTSYASSEWAKLAFQDMIFPPDMEKVKVPYVMLGDRAGAIYDALEIDPSSRPSDALKPKPMPSGQLGMLSDYVFPYSPEMADKLKDTHELVAVSDRMGARPGGNFQELYLVPTKDTLASGKPIPMPDNRVLTKTGAKIERGSNQEPTTQDPIVKMATDALNNPNADAAATSGPR